MKQVKNQPKRITSLLLAAALVVMPMQTAVCAAPSAPIRVADTSSTSGTPSTTNEKTAESLNAQKTAGATKSEVVYASLQNDGNVKGVYIVNRFDPSSEPVKDYGDYASIREISTQGRMESFSDGHYAISTGDAPFFYQGQTKRKTLPWKIQLRYTLDGQPIDAQQLAGKSGTFGLEITVKPTDATAKDSYAQQMMLQTSVTLPGDVAENVQTKDGTLVQAGSNHRIDFIGLPGKEAKIFHLTATVKDFHLPAITFAGVPFSMDINSMALPDFSQDPDLKKLQDGTKALNDATKRLAAGLSAADKGFSALDYGLGRLTGGFSSLQNAGSRLTGGADRFAAGLETLQKNSAPLVAGIRQANTSTKDIEDAMQQVNEGWKGYTQGVSAYVDGAQKSLEAAAPFASGAQQLLDGATKTRDGLSALSEEGGKLVGYSAQIQEALTQMKRSLSSLPNDSGSKTASASALPSPQELAQSEARIKEASRSLQQAKSATDAVYDAFEKQIQAIENQPSPSLEEVVTAAGLSADAPKNPDVQKLLAYQQKTSAAQKQALLSSLHRLTDTGEAPLKALKQGMAEAAGQAEQMEEALSEGLSQIKKMTEAMQHLGSGSSSLSDGVEKLEQQYQTFHQGLRRYVGGVGAVSVHFGGNGLKTTDVVADEAKVLPPTPADTKDGSNSNAKADPTADTHTTSPSAPTTFYAGMKALAGGLAEWQQGVKPLVQGGKALQSPETTQALLEGQEKVRNGIGQYTAGFGRLAGGMQQYTDGVSALANNSSALVDGLASYVDGVNRAANGMTEWQSGFHQFGSGVSQASDGAKRLSDGTGDFADQTSDMDARIREKIDALMGETKKDVKDQTSFADARNGKISQVQFVLMTEEIKKPQEAKEKAPAKKNISLWDRIVNLFTPKKDSEE
ncbi:hypothetical protein [Levyella massiliensis]|uniref:hypothetical protein n=1 Tax=Levyella massiliensis TaxID=938289 RepID=UPI00035EEA3A|nr:hypothetical protein [Levyella massiliensis]